MPIRNPAENEVATSWEPIDECLAQAKGRLDWWVRFVNNFRVERMAELGVYRGDFAENILRQCSLVATYYMIDPWRHLDQWNKPANHGDALLEQCMAEALARTEFAEQRRLVLRGETNEVVDSIPDGNLDFAYVDSDHTLRGIAIDLIRILPKIKPGGWIGGDDFLRSPWQHATAFEPTLVFPFAVHFAEAVGARIYALPYFQFLMRKSETRCFELVDLAGGYGDTSLRGYFDPYKLLALKLQEKRVIGRLVRALHRLHGGAQGH